MTPADEQRLRELLDERYAEPVRSLSIRQRAQSATFAKVLRVLEDIAVGLVEDHPRRPR